MSRHGLTWFFGALAALVAYSIALPARADSARSAPGDIGSGDLITIIDDVQNITTETFDPNDVSTSASILDGCITAGTHRVMRFAFHSRNVGDAPALLGTRPPPACAVCPCANPPTDPVFVWSNSHCHWHIKQFNNYSAVTPADRVAAAGLKQAFCLMDFNQWDPSAPPGNGFDCNNQGVDPGWEDIYSAGLPCQFINMDGVQNGDYRLVATTNSAPTMSEDNIHNNSVNVPLHIQGDTVSMISSNWQPRETITAAPLTQPSVASWGPNRLDVFWTDGGLHHRTKDHEKWIRADNFASPSGVTFTTAPASISWAPGRIDAFAQGSDGNLWHQAFDGAWQSFDNPAGASGLASAPAVTSWGPNILDVFWIDTSGNLEHLYYDFGWGFVENLGNPGVALVQEPRAVSWGQGRIDVVARGSDNRLWHIWWGDSGLWGAWDNPNGIATVTGRPEIVSWGRGVIDIFWPSSSIQALQHTFWQGGWGPVDDLTGPPAATDNAPTVTAWTNNRLDAFVRGSDGQIYHIYWDGSGFGWDVPLSNTDVNGDPVATSWAANELSVVFGVTPTMGKGLGTFSWF